jgi:hypothetical protein
MNQRLRSHVIFFDVLLFEHEKLGHNKVDGKINVGMQYKKKIEQIIKNQTPKSHG